MMSMFSNNKSKNLNLSFLWSLFLGLFLSSSIGQLRALELALVRKFLVTSQVSTDSESLGESLEGPSEAIQPKNSFRRVCDGYDGDESDGAAGGVVREISSPLAAASSDAKLAGASEMPRSVVVAYNPAHAALVRAIYSNDLAGVIAAVESGADASAYVGICGHSLWYHHTCLMFAVRFKRLDIVNYLLTVPGINVNRPESISGNTALFYALDLPLTTLVLGRDHVTWSVDDSSAMAIIESLLKHSEIAVNKKNKAGFTALDNALLGNYKDDKLAIIKLLLKKGADPVNLSKQARTEICKFLEHKIIKERSTAALASGDLSSAELELYAPTLRWGLSKGYQAVIEAREFALEGLENKTKIAADYTLYLEHESKKKADSLKLAWDKTKTAFAGGSKALVLY